MIHLLAQVSAPTVPIMHNTCNKGGDIMSRKIFRIVPNGSMWSIKYNGDVQSSHQLKSLAIESGRRLAIANQPSQLVIHKSDGTIETEYTYGNDPYPPKG